MPRLSFDWDTERNAPYPQVHIECRTLREVSRRQARFHARIYICVATILDVCPARIQARTVRMVAR